MRILESLLKWQNYVHYLLLTIGLTIFMHFRGIHALHTEMFLPNLNFLLLFVFLLALDTLIHIIFAVLPENYGKWED